MAYDYYNISADKPPMNFRQTADKSLTGINFQEWGIRDYSLRFDFDLCDLP
ncbi:MAG: hypothetical protein ABIG63_05180 [Chloroflexota bacterium]